PTRRSSDLLEGRHHTGISRFLHRDQILIQAARSSHDTKLKGALFTSEVRQYQRLSRFPPEGRNYRTAFRGDAALPLSLDRNYRKLDRVFENFGAVFHSVGSSEPKRR